MRARPLLTIVVAAAVAVVGCQSDTTAPLVVEPAPPSLTVVPAVATIGGRSFIRLVARVHNQDGTTSEPADVRWSSADERIATVGASGTVEALQAGRVQIVASWKTSRGSSTVIVTDQVAKKPADPPSPEN
jgi:hypothetical protein